MTTDALRRRFLETGGIVILLLVAVATAAAIIEPRFLNRLNILNVLRNFSFLAVPAIGQMIVMTTGGFDLSVGATMALASVVTAAQWPRCPKRKGSNCSYRWRWLWPVAPVLAW